MIQALWVDDDAASMSFASRADLLREAGIHVELCNSVRELSAHLANSLLEFDIILVDLMMPPLGVYSPDETNRGLATGLKVIESIRAKNKDIPILVISVIKRDSLAQDMETHKVSGWFQKPLSIEELVVAIRRIIHTR